MVKYISPRKNSVPVTRQEVKQMLRSLDNSKELKKSTDTYSGTTAAAGVVISLSGVIVQGDNLNNRVGDTITMRSVQTTFSTKVGAQTNFVRFIVFVDRYNVGSTPAVTDVLNNATITSYLAFSNDQQNRFRILSDDVYKVNLVSTPNAIQERTHKMKMSVHYPGTGAGTASNSIFAIVLTDATVTQPTYSFDVNMRYNDA